jgi:hypothetical protein
MQPKTTDPTPVRSPFDGLSWAELDLSRAAGPAVAACAVAAGLLVDLAMRSGADGLAGAFLAVAVAGMLLVAGRPAGHQARAVIGAAAVFGGFLAVRASPWLLPLDVLAAGGLLALGASLARGGSVLDLPVLGLLRRAVHAGLHGLAGPAFAWQGLNRRSRPGPGGAPAGGDTAGTQVRSSHPGVAVLRGVTLAVPLLLVLGALLASADVLFASFFAGLPEVDDLSVHGVLVAAGAWGMAGLLRVAAAVPPGDGPRQVAFVGPVEATVVLGSLVVLFAAFAGAQVVALTGGGRHVVETAGLTYAEYARSGFFQLVAVAAITLVVLLALHVLTGPADPATRRRLLVGSELCVGLTLVVVASALRRLDLYENAYGLTMLRLYASVFVGWIGVSLALLGAWVAWSGGRAWFVAAAFGTGLAALLGLNVINPEALVVRRNVALAERTGRFDPGYLTGLSADAVPQMVRSLPRLDDAGRSALLAAICAGPGSAEGGWAAWNAAEDAAIEARNGVCR